MNCFIEDLINLTSMSSNYGLELIWGNGKLFAKISKGDNFISDPILNIRIKEQKITEMNYAR
ncbi:hypothetical protein CLU96_3318 [Chryseobacterium sp. 52]|nr:hypothetical protein CLU96_3318 [Chryseobacterium sp. 52]